MQGEEPRKHDILEKAAVTDISENNCTCPEKQTYWQGVLFLSLSVYLIFAACHAAFIHLSLVKWVLMGSSIHLTLLFCFLCTTVLCELKIKEWTPVIYDHRFPRLVFSLTQTDIFSLPYTHITLYILLLTLKVCLRWSQCHFNSSKYQVHMWLFIILWKLIINLLICFKRPPWKFAY